MNPQAYIEMSRTEDTHWWFNGRRAILKSTIEQLNLPDNASILEIGCGTGGNLNMLSQFGHVSGLEMDEHARKLATDKTKDNIQIKAGKCPSDIPFDEKSFDLICMFDVLEHIEEDLETLKAIKLLLKDNGQVLITVPAHQWLWGAHDEYLHHKRRYSIKNLKHVIKASGFVCQRISFINFFLAPLAVMARVMDKMTGSKTGTGGDVPPKPVNSLFGVIFGFEKNLTRHVNLPWGISIMAILKP